MKLRPWDEEDADRLGAAFGCLIPEAGVPRYFAALSRDERDLRDRRNLARLLERVAGDTPAQEIADEAAGSITPWPPEVSRPPELDPVASLTAAAVAPPRLLVPGIPEASLS
jgi:hypothetical protein